MTAFARKVAEAAHVPPERLERLSGGDLSEVLLVRRGDGRLSVAKGGSAIVTEAAMLRALASADVPVPMVEGEVDGVLLLEHVPNDAVFSERAWASVGAALRRLHNRTAESYGWPVDYQIGTVVLENRERADWPTFWGEQRLSATAAILDRPLRERVGALVPRLGDLLPEAPPPSLLHGDLWSGNILVRDGALAAFIDPACYHGHAEVDLAMLTLFDEPAESFWAAYGAAEPDWQERRAVYQLFPALAHLRLFGGSYSGMVSRLLDTLCA
ncbi:MAG TPA: fructosamine kinase family protein [Allosphingosinicella sp.]|jgi:fructosamine-3-kinase